MKFFYIPPLIHNGTYDFISLMTFVLGCNPVQRIAVDNCLSSSSPSWFSSNTAKIAFRVDT